MVLVEAMKNVVLDSLNDLEVLAEGWNTWEITNYQKLQTRNLGPEFELGEFKW